MEGKTLLAWHALEKNPTDASSTTQRVRDLAPGEYAYVDTTAVLYSTSDDKLYINPEHKYTSNTSSTKIRVKRLKKGYKIKLSEKTTHLIASRTDIPSHYEAVSVVRNPRAIIRPS